MVGSSRNRISGRWIEPARDLQPALHAARERPRQIPAALVEVDEAQRLVDARRALGARHAVGDRVQHQVLLGGQPIVQRRVLEDDADAPAHLVRRRRDVQPRQPRASRRRLQQRAEDLDGRRLAGAVRPEEPEDLAGADGEPDPAHRLHLTVRLGEILDLDDRGHADVRIRRRRIGGGTDAARRPAAGARRAHDVVARRERAGGIGRARRRRAARTPGSGSRRNPCAARRRSGTGSGIQSSPRNARSAGEVAPDRRQRPRADVLERRARRCCRAWWHGSTTPSGVTTM